MSSGEEDAQSVLRKKVLAIQRDASLSPAEKSRKIQDIMMAKWRSGNAGASQATSDECDDKAKSWYSPPSETGDDEGILGCKHYPRKCKLWAECCSKFVTCRLCHDEETGDPDHVLDRFSVSKILCMECGTEQAPATNCANCNIAFASYTCLKCNLFDGNPNKSIYHCDKCGLCRVGEGLGIDFWHCDTCQMCLSIDLENHICIEKNIMSNCPVCRDYMFTSTESIQILPRCGHCMHESCFREYVESSLVCPLCSKTIYDMTEQWRRLDNLMALSPMPEDYAESVAHLLCNDCSGRCQVPFNFRGHKCSHCGSYNTRAVHVDHPEHITAARLGGAIPSAAERQAAAAAASAAADDDASASASASEESVTGDQDVPVVIDMDVGESPSGTTTAVFVDASTYEANQIGTEPSVSPQHPPAVVDEPEPVAMLITPTALDVTAEYGHTGPGMSPSSSVPENGSAGGNGDDDDNEVWNVMASP
ncbi:CHY zinc finger domain-containing protein [Thecamonas trahens ATCC 50062]|uniref:CHY zinc finger domain-containing protein n=1 Tax=Thecamonas trahens ATCC 50062 TaxID=461836 RepID=A0A0L0DMR8_THETB|nr:CHY zinc finger domain-containing protein [Thecamonas trahens ATCC 50062]KNC53594.1 CHY zinc finger domain-containing protein [Thecamonas trahens ATCC 50062]|eukprot:XP_013761911.1 CHY zinc finger domain-containing protein [Thecamonas trahens ATCC 50062]